VVCVNCIYTVTIVMTSPRRHVSLCCLLLPAACCCVCCLATHMAAHRRLWRHLRRGRNSSRVAWARRQSDTDSYRRYWPSALVVAVRPCRRVPAEPPSLQPQAHAMNHVRRHLRHSLPRLRQNSRVFPGRWNTGGLLWRRRMGAVPLPLSLDTNRSARNRRKHHHHPPTTPPPWKLCSTSCVAAPATRPSSRTSPARSAATGWCASWAPPARASRRCSMPWRISSPNCASQHLRVHAVPVALPLLSASQKIIAPSAKQSIDQSIDAGSRAGASRTTARYGARACAATSASWNRTTSCSRH
jgi:hypothetical protein